LDFCDTKHFVANICSTYLHVQISIGGHMTPDAQTQIKYIVKLFFSSSCRKFSSPNRIL